MFERFRKKKQLKGQAVEPDGIPEHVMPNHENIVALGYDAKQYIKGFLEGLTRTQLMDFQDNKQFDGTKAEDAAWEAANDAEWERDYPLGKHSFSERIPDIVKDVINPYKLGDLKKQVEGIQKKLDKVETLISTAEFTLCGKDALKL